MPLKRQMKIVHADNNVVGRVRVAFATSNLEEVDEHFGAATKLAIYDVGPDGSDFVEVAEFTPAVMDGNENKLLAKFEALEGCHAVFSLAVGSSAVRQLVARGIQPIKLNSASTIFAVLDHVEKEIRNGTTPWITKAFQPAAQDAEERLESLLDEAWDE